MAVSRDYSRESIFFSTSRKWGKKQKQAEGERERDTHLQENRREGEKKTRTASTPFLLSHHSRNLSTKKPKKPIFACLSFSQT